MLPYDELFQIAEARTADYTAAGPFPHIALDGLFPSALLDSVVGEFPGADAIEWTKFADGTGRKLATRSEEQMGELTRAFLRELNSSRFITFLERLTGIDGLIPDPHFEGGGLHQIERGGYLKIHADFNKHPRLGLDRRINLLLYLNKDWQEDYGGALELWTKDMARCERQLLPIFNRMVVFSTTDWAFHGHPTPLTCPEGVSRKSIALYYYSNGRPENEVSRAHSTLYQRRPDDRVFSVAKLARSFFHRLRHRINADV